ncbi:hypothetical protein [Arthrobacter sp. ISL-30]|uniref:hypothetical protein n=1 Tax=Arthrobacter sp. ISL-30 TaxID=2819109 RepID=UPI001BE95753|nr:hypothetical protein [Arthrobacter sp. ISL-30]MBT2515772.1 hypothetical protein [Arthrobacter sp. ISL-30]
MTTAPAEAAVAEGCEWATGNNKSFIVAAHHLESAIQLFRGTSHRYREERGLESRLAEIRGLHREYSQRATEEFAFVRSGSIDLTSIVRAAEDKVQGKDTMSALLGLISVVPIPSVQQLSNLQRERVAKGSIADLIGRSIITNGGRVAYKVPALEPDSEEYVVASHVVTSHQMFIGSLVQGAIAPALRSGRQACLAWILSAKERSLTDPLLGFEQACRTPHSRQKKKGRWDRPLWYLMGRVPFANL